MKSRRRKLYCVTALACLFFPAYGMISSEQRNREVQLFFSDDMVWTKAFADENFDFCKLKAWPSSLRAKLGDEVVIFSPSRRFVIREEEVGVSNLSKLKIVDLTSKRVALVFPHNSGAAEVKWDPEEKYAISLLGVSKDDFSQPKIYVGNLTTGKIIYLTNATISSCDNPGW